LTDPDLREKARACLVEIGTPEAAQALVNALPADDPAFTCALLDGLAAVRDPIVLREFLRMTNSNEPTIRAAALRSVAWTGDPDLVMSFKKVIQRADETTRRTATDAFLRLADHIARKGGNFASVMGIYRWVLTKSEDPRMKEAAIAGLGRYGDETVIPEILQVVNGSDGREFEPAALSAFAHLEGFAASQALLEVYPSFKGDLKLDTLALFGTRRDAMYLPLFEENLKNGDATTRKVVLKALVDSQLPEAVGLIKADLATREGEEKAADLAAMKQLAERFQIQPNAQLAGEAWYVVYQNADTEELRAEALKGVIRFPVAESLTILLETIKTSEMLTTTQLRSALEIAKGLQASGRGAESEQATKLILAKLNTSESLTEALPLLTSLWGPAGCAKKLGFITQWSLVGPFPWSLSQAFTKSYIGEPEIDLKANYTENGKQLSWTKSQVENGNGLLDLLTVYPATTQATAYGYAVIKVTRKVEATIRVGSDDGIKVWVNEEAVLERNVDRGAAPDQDQAPIQLNEGENRILIQVTQGGGGWNACVRLTERDGTVLAF
jgi:HEAT repeat protein